jgi:flagellar basal-body rod protein FlgB
MSEPIVNASAATALDLAQLALRLEHLNARVQAENVARLGAGSNSLFSTQIDAAYTALRQAAGSQEAASALLDSAARDINTFAGLERVPVPADASLDDLVMAMTRTSSRYQAIADGISRQMGLMQLAIKGAR